MESKKRFCDELHPRFSRDFKRLVSVVEAMLFLFFEVLHKVDAMEAASYGFFNDQRIQIQATFLSHQSYKCIFT